ncbi:MAG: OB-fold domain-containing protein [Pseudomonadota bacterium]
MTESAPVELETCGCGAAWLARRGFCPLCGSKETTVVTSRGRGVVWASTLVHRAPLPSAIGPPPYGLLLAVLDDFPRVRVMALSHERLQIGAAVSLVRLDSERSGAPYLATLL